MSLLKWSLIKKSTKQARGDLYSQINHERPALVRFLSSIDYEKGLFQMDVLYPKIDKPEK